MRMCHVTDLGRSAGIYIFTKKKITFPGMLEIRNACRQFVDLCSTFQDKGIKSGFLQNIGCKKTCRAAARDHHTLIPFSIRNLK